MVIVTARVAPTGNGDEGDVSFAVTGATTLAASDSNAVAGRISGGNGGPTITTQSSTVTYLTVTPGSNVFTLQYKEANGSATFSNRTLTVVPLS
jgi:hypothetical protein